jgi:hypothetical protein
MFGTDDRVKTKGALVRSIAPIQPLLVKKMIIMKVKQENNLPLI